MASAVLGGLSIEKKGWVEEVLWIFPEGFVPFHVKRKKLPAKWWDRHITGAEATQKMQKERIGRYLGGKRS